MHLKPILDLSKKYSLVLEGGGAKGAYQIGAWRALKEAGVCIQAVAGTSVGALNGAMICMDDLEKAEKIWSEITSSNVMEVDDEWMERFFKKETSFKEVLQKAKKHFKEGGIDISPLKYLIQNVVEEDKVRKSGIDFLPTNIFSNG